MRRFVGVAAVVALALGGVFVASSVGAAAPPFDAVGSVQCTMLGRYKMTPGLTTTARAGVAQTFKAKLGCTGATGGAGVAVTGGHITGTGNAATMSCATAAVPFVRATIAWKTKGGKINPTVIKWASGTTVTTPRVKKTLAGAQATVTGSYSGSAARATIVSDTLGQAACGTKAGMKLFKFTGVGGASALALPGTGATSTTSTTAATTPPVNGTLLFSDEFNGSTLDSSKWVALNRVGDQSNNEAQCYRPANVTVGGGVVSMTSKADTSCAGHSYTSGNIQWKTFNYTYGTIDIRAKLAGGNGTWPADWMIGHNCQVSNVTSADNTGTCSWPNPGSEEIDIAEMWNESKTTVHENYLSSGPSFSCGADNLSDVSANWHIYTLVWSPGHLVWKVDGVQKCVATIAPSSAMFLTLNTAMGGSHGGTIVASTLPQVHAIDYVRVYR
jgi:beta-glucanase (GH16 family)